MKALVALAAVVAGCAAGKAQTAPQLLPYTSRLIAGGGTQTTAKGGTCPSGLTASDAFGDGCLATEIVLSSTGATTTKPYGARYAVADATGAVYFTDATAGLVRRVDPTTGIVTAFAGGASSSPSNGNTCGSLTSTDSRGDGCLSTAVHLTYPMGLAIAANGDLIFTDVGQYDVRRVAAVNGVLPAAAGVISNVAGYVAGGATYGYTANNATTTIIAATQSYLDGPYNVAIDSQGDIIIAEEFKNAVLVVNPGTTTTTVTGVSIPAGSIAKITGESTATGYTGTPYCPNGSSGTFGCNYNPFTEGASANLTYLDSPYAVAVDGTGNVYIANEYNNVVPKVSTAGVLTTYAGNQTKSAKTTARGVAPFAIGSPFGVAADSYNNLYITDALNGVVWRVDGAGQYQYVVAGGASSTCTGTTDTYGDGCPATQSTFGSSGSTYATAANPGIFGVTIDAAGDLFLGDTITNLVREVSTNTQFGQVGSAVTQTLDIHFAAGDTPSSNAYTLTQTSANFTLGTATCTSNSDTTTDCLLPVTAAAATSTTLGAFSATLKVTSSLGGANTFALTGTHVQSPNTRTTVGIASSNTGSCTGSTVYSTGATFTLTATIASTGSPAGSVQFYSNGAAIGLPVNVSGSTASLSYSFPTAGSYVITATYSGDTYFKTSSSAGTTASTITTSKPGFSGTLVEKPNNGSVVQGQTALYSFSLAQSVYSGTITFSVSGLPANSSAIFSPATITGGGCSTSNTVAMSILTQLAPVKQAGLAGRGPWRLLLTLVSVLLVCTLALRRRGMRGSWARISLMLALLVASTGLLACGLGAQSGVSTPTGTYNITVLATGSDGSTSTMTTSLTVTPYTDPYH